MKKEEIYIIAEIGQNHNGSVDIAKSIIDTAALPVHEELFHLSLNPVNAVKLTKRDLNQELSASQMNAPYNSPHSFGKTYGEHRSFLELNEDQHFELYRYAKSKGLDFVETLCAPKCLNMLKLFTPDYLKVASRDLTNLVLLEHISETKIPVILSTGMAEQKELDNALQIITKYHSNISILHCISQYPAEPQNVNLKTITYLKKHYPQYNIGYSDHTIGIATPLCAAAMGANIIEKHVTLDRNMKGTDQAGSLAPDGLKRMVRDIRLFEQSLGTEDIFIDASVKTAQKKLERSIASKQIIAAGETITEQSIHLLSPGDGFKWSEKNLVLGKTAIRQIPANEIIYPQMIK
jgi:sialic acid synthase